MWICQGVKDEYQPWHFVKEPSMLYEHWTWWVNYKQNETNNIGPLLILSQITLGK